MCLSSKEAAPAAAINAAPNPATGKNAPPVNTERAKPIVVNITPKNKATSFPKFIIYINASIVALRTASIMEANIGPIAGRISAKTANIFCIAFTASQARDKNKPVKFFAAAALSFLNNPPIALPSIINLLTNLVMIGTKTSFIYLTPAPLANLSNA